MTWLLVTTAEAGSLNAWGLALGRDSVAVMPFASAGDGGEFSQIYAAAGIGDAVDVNVAAGTAFAWDGGTETTLELLPRVFVSDTVGLGVHLYWTAGTEGVVLGPEAHGEWSAGRFTLGANVGWTPALALGATFGDVWAVIAPEVYLADRWSVFCEVDPVVPVTGDLPGVTLVPGVGAMFDAEGAHSASLGLGVTPGPTPGWNVGLAWTSVFSTAGRARPVVAGAEPVADPAAR